MRTWKRLPIVPLLLALAIGSIAGCSNDAPPLSPTATPGVNFSTDVAPYQLVFISRGYDSENDQTTFLYQLQNVDDVESEETPVIFHLTNVTVELPLCAPAPLSFSPPDGASLQTNPNGIYGVQWGVGYDENPDYYYSVTFPGDVPQGVVRGMVSTGGSTYVQNLDGPCEGNYQIAGTVYVDGNGDGAQNGNELGIGDVTVRLSDGESEQFFKTDSDGNYLFIAETGNYSVSVDSLTADSDFNETLYQVWNPTSPTSIAVTVGPDAADKDFGWDPDVESIVAQIDAGDLPTDGKSYKWWRKEFLRVIEGQDNTAYTAAELLAFVQEIEEMALLDEYNFTPGQELVQVYNILNSHFFEDGDGESIERGKGNDVGRHDALEFLIRELLTTELNHVSGRGLTDKQLQAILVSWGETVLNNNSPGGGGEEFFGIKVGEPQRALESPLEGGGTIFRKVNGATGGGGTGE